MAAWQLVRQFLNGLSYHAGVVFDKQAISIAGSSNGVEIPWVLRSHDGQYGDFIAQNPNGLSARERHAACVFDGRIWVSGGHSTSVVAHDDVLYSRDGKEWIHASTLSLPVFNHRMVSFGTPMHELVVLGGYDTNLFYHNIYRSKGNNEWEKVRVQGEQWDARSGFGCIVYKNKLWVFGGVDENESKKDVWYTDDLIHWHKSDSDVPWGPLCDFGYCEWDERVWVIGGQNLDNLRKTQTTNHDVWFSRDMVNWEKTFEFPNEVYHTWSAVIDNRLHVFGGVNNETNVYRLILG